MATKVTKKAFEHWKLVLDEIKGYVIADELEPKQKEICNKLRHTQLMIEFSYKCLYDGERPLSRKDYGRLKFTEGKIHDRMAVASDKRTKSENEAFQRGCRKMMIDKGLYPFGITADTAIEEDEDIKRFYEEGRYKRGGFVDKFIAHIHHI